MTWELGDAREVSWSRTVSEVASGVREGMTGGEAGLLQAPKAHTRQSGLNQGKLVSTVQPHQPPTQPCPECGSQRVWKDGIRYTRSGNVQRYICRECGHRFSDGSDPPEHVERVHTNKSYRPSGYILDRRVSVALAEGTKNLAEVKSRIEKWAAGATKPTPADVKGKLLEYAWWMKKQGYAEDTIATRTGLLRLLTRRGANLFDPESIKEAIAQQRWKEGSKAQAVAAYATFIKMMGWVWNPPRYKQGERLPFIPLETEIDQLIAGCGKKTGTFLQTLKETAARFGEAWRLRWINVDSVRNTITINDPEKNSKPRIVKVSSKLIAMINRLPKKSEMIFATTDKRGFRIRYWKRRRRMAQKLQNPRILKISFHTLRHWKATMEYQRTRDLLYVRNLLGHKKIESTLIYTQLVNFESDEYHVKVAKTLEEACELAEAGFEYFTTIEETQIFRKRK